MKILKAALVVVTVMLPAFFLVRESGGAEAPHVSPAPEIVTALSSGRESYLVKYYPIVTERLSPLIPVYPWDKLHLTSLAGWSYALSPEAVDLYQKTADALSQEIQNPGDPMAMEKKYLIADLRFAAALNAAPGDVSELFKTAQIAYEQAVRSYPDSPRSLPAVYHLGLILLQAGEQSQCLQLVRRYETLWNQKPAWGRPFRSLVMEAYYRRGRYMRAEDYLWNLSGSINREELNSHLALRYGDSLFWQKKYREAAEWYEKVQEFLDHASSAAARVSRLYYAESLFQTGQSEKARLQFMEFEKTYDGSSKALLSFRILQTQIDTNETDTSVLGALSSLAKREKGTEIGDAAMFQWARLILYRSNHVLYSEAQNFLKDFLRNQGVQASLNFHNSRSASKSMKDEGVFLLALTEWRLGSPAAALEHLLQLISDPVVPEFASPLAKTSGDAMAVILTEMAPSYWESQDYVGFLVLCDHFGRGVEIAATKPDVLLWVGRAYLESGMTAASARLFQRLLTQMELKPYQRDRVLLELARAYGILGEKDLLGKTLALLKEVPSRGEERRLYHYVRALNDVGQERYNECVGDIQSLLNEGVRGDELFRISLQGAVCARKSKHYDQAEKFVGMIGISDIIQNSTASSSASGVLRRWQEDAFFEKINLLIATEKRGDAIRLFEKVTAARPEAEPPLETVFMVISAYREEGQPDQASALWKAYSEKDRSLPGNFRTQFAQLLEMLSQTELLPRY